MGHITDKNILSHCFRIIEARILSVTFIDSRIFGIAGVRVFEDVAGVKVSIYNLLIIYMSIPCSTIPNIVECGKHDKENPALKQK